MNEELLASARKLASRPYSVEAERDETTDGELIYVARTRELPGCIGQGESIEAAVSDLHAARIDYIVTLLEDGLPVPDPISMATTTSSLAEPDVKVYGSRTADRPEEVDETTEIERPNRLYEALVRV